MPRHSRKGRRQRAHHRAVGLQHQRRLKLKFLCRAGKQAAKVPVLARSRRTVAEELAVLVDVSQQLKRERDAKHLEQECKSGWLCD